MVARFWTDVRLARAEELLCTMTLRAAASVLSEEYGRVITGNALQGARWHRGHPDWWKKYAGPTYHAVDVAARVQPLALVRYDRSRMTVTARLMGDPPPGRTPWAA